MRILLPSCSPASACFPPPDTMPLCAFNRLQVRATHTHTHMHTVQHTTSEHAPRTDDTSHHTHHANARNERRRSLDTRCSAMTTRRHGEICSWCVLCVVHCCRVLCVVVLPVSVCSSSPPPPPPHIPHSRSSPPIIALDSTTQPTTSCVQHSVISRRRATVRWHIQ